MNQQNSFFVFKCFNGPDQGKSILILPNKNYLMGNQSNCDLVCSDPTVGGFHASISLVNNQLHIATFTGHVIEHNNKTLEELMLSQKGVVKIGMGDWQFYIQVEAAPRANKSGFISKLLGLQQLDDEFKISNILSTISEKRSDLEIEKEFSVGTISSTPAINNILISWPRPWLFLRVGIGAIIVFVLFYTMFQSFQNQKLLPGLIVVGSFAIPFACLLFFWELNAPQNVSIYQVIKLVFLGGTVSLFFSLVFFSVFDIFTKLFGASGAGIIEEAGKFLTFLRFKE